MFREVKSIIHFLTHSFLELPGDGKQVTAVGERTLNDQTTASLSTMYQSSIVVSIVEEGAAPNVEPKKLVPWLHSNHVCFLKTFSC